MKVLLVYPRTKQPGIPKPSWVRLGLCFIAAVLRNKGHDVSIFDRFACQAHFGNDRARINAEMVEHVERFRPDIIGFNTISPLIFDTAECINLLRKDFHGAIIAGGHHATALPELTLQRIAGLDGVVEGEGEYAMERLAAGHRPETIPGLWWKNRGGDITRNKPKQIEDLDSLPFPALDLLDLSFYLRPSTTAIRGRHLATLSVLTSRGCNNRCSFCAESLTYGPGVRYHSPSYVVEWLRQIKADFSVQGVYLLDNNFLIHEGRAVAICEGLIQSGLNRKLKWAIQARADSLTPELLRLLKRSGCVHIEIGIEFAVQQALDRVNKRTTVERNEEAIRLCKRHGIAVHAYMITGYDGETITDLERQLDWVKKVRPTTFQWTYLRIYPGTPLYRTMNEGFFENREWSEENLAAYYANGRFSPVSPEAREHWIALRFTPYHRWQTRLAIARLNPVSTLIVLIMRKATSILAMLCLRGWRALRGRPAETTAGKEGLNF
jgi:anaerobic magnesium-protoporphyrin IX monomethyl ester cyclase